VEVQRWPAAARVKTGVIKVCVRCDSQGRCGCKGAKRISVPVIRVDALRVPVEAACGLLEDLTAQELHEVLWDLQAEVSRRLLRREVQDAHE
jgi:hypothetical protein